ncbi:tail fiber assembly protein [Aeromonas sp. SCS5]|uniref:tail fiber assembly protein n=1 Tax=Aeromonas sp. SCS5 TaxID=1519205 RepID=UPI000904510F|nr:tail fiber assembly protein [Aeromonas sp. SCS5]
MSEPKVLWGDDGFASQDGWCDAFCALPSTGEYSGKFEVWVSRGTGLPAGAYLTQPPEPVSGKAIVMKNGAWSLVDDYRNQIAYNKTNRQSVVISDLGPLPSDLTFIPPSSRFDVWDEVVGSWVKDSDAERLWLTTQAQKQRASLLSEASIEIASLLDALDPDVISNPDDQVQAKLLLWKQYRAALAVIDCTTHPVQWPSKPV